MIKKKIETLAAMRAAMELIDDRNLDDHTAVETYEALRLASENLSGEIYADSVLAAYVAGRENAFEYYQGTGLATLAPGESDADYVHRAALIDFDDGVDSLVYPDLLPEGVAPVLSNGD